MQRLMKRRTSSLLVVRNVKFLTQFSIYTQMWVQASDKNGILTSVCVKLFSITWLNKSLLTNLLRGYWSLRWNHQQNRWRAIFRKFWKKKLLQAKNQAELQNFVTLYIWMILSWNWNPSFIWSKSLSIFSNRTSLLNLPQHQVSSKRCSQRF